MKFLLFFLIFFYACANQPFRAKLIKAEKEQNKEELGRKPSSFGVKLERVHVIDEADRLPAWLYIPKKYSKKKNWPLVISLHGYRGTPFFQEILIPFLPYVNKKGFILAIPKGLKDKKGMRYWNATKGCCDFDGRNQNDVTYLRDLIKEISKLYNIDSKKIFLFGHSNGGFMGYKMACDASDLISGIVSWAGSTFLNPMDCKNENPVTILQIHGKKDKIIKFEGTSWHPSAEETINQWVKFAGCSEKRFVENEILGARVGSYKTLNQKLWKRCRGGKKVALWTSEKGGHVYLLGKHLTKKILDFLF